MLADRLDALERLLALLAAICIAGHGASLHTRRAVPPK
jgi:hypothetical protein